MKMTKVVTLNAIWAALFCALPSVQAGVGTIGDVTPDPATSTSSTDLYIGNAADGTVTVDGG